MDDKPIQKMTKEEIEKLSGRMKFMFLVFLGLLSYYIYLYWKNPLTLKGSQAVFFSILIGVLSSLVYSWRVFALAKEKAK